MEFVDYMVLASSRVQSMQCILYTGSAEALHCEAILKCKSCVRTFAYQSMVLPCGCLSAKRGAAPALICMSLSPAFTVRVAHVTA